MDPAAATDPQARAVVGLSGSALRYVEVVHTGGALRLRRLGVVDFEADAEAAVFGTDDEVALADLRAALAEVLGGTAAPTLTVVAHPSVVTTFFTPLPAGLAPLERDVQIRQEAALLADVAPTQAVRVQSVPVRTERAAGGDREWYHTVHVPEPAHARLAGLADALGAGSYALADATRAVAATLRAGASAGADVAVGAYPGHTEVVVTLGGDFLFGHHGEGTTPADTAYFALAALQQAGLGAGDVGRLLTYGDAAGPDRLSLLPEFVGLTPEPLDPFAAFERRPDVSPEALATFAPVLGAALG